MIEKVLVVVVGVILFFDRVHSQGSSSICRTNEFEMTCRGRNSLKKLDTDKSYSSVDTITIHQSSLDLTDDLVPDGVDLNQVTLFNATNNQITRIGSRGFAKIPKVQFLYLSNNQIAQAQHDPFQHLDKLEILEMEDSLGGNVEEKADMLRNFFHSKNKFIHLNKIMLNKNGIEEIYPKTFCGIEGLKRLELSNNRISSFSFARHCLGELKGLMLAGNLIEKIPSDIWDFLPAVSTIDLSHNPLNCDCETVKIFSGDDVIYMNQADTRCASPPEVEGKRVFELPANYCNVPRNPRGKSSFFQFIVLFVIAIGILWAYKKYRERLSHMSSTPVGYTNLQHEQAVEPEFV